jgi:hypothetical protein
MSETAQATDWTCSRCHMKVSFAKGTEGVERPKSWAEVDGEFYCLHCRRDMAGEAGIADMPDETSPAELQKLKSAARIEFEVRRDPERPDNQVAKVCHTSVVAVRKARERMGLAPTEN